MGRAGWSDKQAIDAYMEYLQFARGRSLRTLESYRMALERLGVFMQGESILGASGAELEAFSGKWLNQQGVVARSRKPYISALKGFFQWARVSGLVEVNEALALQHPKSGSPLPDVISIAHAEKLLCAPDLATFRGIRDSAMLHLLAGCGLRVSGLVGLNEGDFTRDLIDKKERLVLKLMEKGNRERRMVVPREAEAVLMVYLGHEDLHEIDRHTTNRHKRADKVLFVSTRNSTVAEGSFIGEARRISRQSVHEMIQKYGVPLGIPAKHLHPHAFRHLFGTELTEEDVPSLSVQSLLGHSDPKSTAIYVELSMRKKARAVDAHGPLAKVRTPISELLKRLPG